MDAITLIPNEVRLEQDFGGTETSLANLKGFPFILFSVKIQIQVLNGVHLTVYEIT